MPSSTTQVQWLKLPAWKVGDREFVSRSGLLLSEKQNVQYILKSLRER